MLARPFALHRADRIRLLALAGAAAVSLCTMSAVRAAEPAVPAGLDRYVTKAMRAFGAPGLSLAIVQNGKTLMAKGYGVRSIATRAPVGGLVALRRQIIGKSLAAMKNLPQQYKPNEKSSLPVARYEGTYADPWYGTMTVSARGAGKLWIRFDRTPGMEGSFEHVANDTFRAHWTDRGIEDAYVTFDVKAGHIRSIAMKPVSPLADFSFDYQDLHFRPSPAAGA